MTRPAPTVTVPRTDLERVRDLLMERIYGSPARSPAHNARLEVEDMLSAAPAAPQAAGGGEIAQIITGYRNLGPHSDRDAAIAHLCDLLERQSLRAPSREPEGGAVKKALVEDFKLLAEIKGRRAQPQAREDALREAVGPIAGCLTAFPYDPGEGDAEEVEITLTRKEVKTICALAGLDPVTGEALAALQAEQGAK